MARTKVILAGCAALGAAATGYLQRKRAAGTSPSGQAIEPPQPSHQEQAPPQPSNFDASGPVANTATPIPAPDHHPQGAIDEAEEERAAAAEAAAIGGAAPDYPGLAFDEPADPAFAPLSEAGEGENEGGELAEYDHRREAESQEGMSDAERQIDEIIEAQSDPHSGEIPDHVPPPHEAGGDEGDQTWSGRPAGP